MFWIICEGRTHVHIDFSSFCFCIRLGTDISPPARWGLLDFIRVVLLILLLLLRLLRLPPPPVSPRPCLHQLPRPLPPCQLVANLFANFHAQWALLDLNCRLPIWVGTAGPQPPGSERSGRCWTSTAGFRSEWARLDLNRQVLSAVGTAGPQLPASEPSGLNLGPSELSGHRWTSTWDLPSSVGTAGPQRPDRMPEDMPDRTPDRMSECQKICQIKCQKICQIEC